MRRAVPVFLALVITLVGCSHSSKGGAASVVTTTGGATSSGTGAPGTGANGSTGNGSTGNGPGGNGAGGGGVAPENSGLFATGTIPTGSVAHSGPTTTAPSPAVWVKTHAAALKSLKGALNDVANAFAKKDDAALSKALVTCANVAAPLSRTAAGSLPKAQADALSTVADQCASITHMLKSGDTAGVAAARPVLDAAVSTLAPTFAAAGA